MLDGAAIAAASASLPGSDLFILEIDKIIIGIDPVNDLVGLVIPHIGYVLIFTPHEPEKMIPSLGFLIVLQCQMALEPCKFLGFLLGYIELRPVGHGHRVLYAHVNPAGLAGFRQISDLSSQAKLYMEAIRLPQ